MFARQVLYSGHVQGVGFRAAVKRLATGFDVTGHVKNLPDGRVEMFAQCFEAEEMHEFLEAISESSLAAHIKSQEIHPVPPQPTVQGFTIVR